MNNIDILLQRLNSSSFSAKDFLSEIAKFSELIEVKDAICRLLTSAVEILETRKLNDMKSNIEMIESARKDLLESNVAYRNLVAIAENVNTYSKFSKYCLDNKIKNNEMTFEDKLSLTKIKNKNTI